MSNTARPFVIAVVGAGIGGLAAAISLRRLPNVEVHVFEQAEELREVWPKQCLDSLISLNFLPLRRSVHRLPLAPMAFAV